MIRLALKIDVDTLVGFQEGVPALLEVLRKWDVPASFFVAMGPDNSGRAIRRIFTRKGFLKKMLRTGAPRLYGFKTMLYGTILPAPMIAAADPQLFRSIAAAGHELGLHGYDHVHWHDHLVTMSPSATQAELRRAQGIFQEIMGHPARAFAAPGWQCSPAARAALAAEGFVYASNTRGCFPFFPRYDGEVSTVLEIPTTLPTLDEYLGLDGRTPTDFFAAVLEEPDTSRVQVLTIHAEVEGRPYLVDFSRFIEQAQSRQISFLRLGDYAAELLRQPRTVPLAPVVRGTLPGRAGEVSCQGPAEETT